MIGLDNNNSYDFFGVKRKNKANAGFSYLGRQVRVAPRETLRLKEVNFIGTPAPNALGMKSYPNKIKQVKYWELKPLYKKESIKQKHLSKWGDADMDGSPNYFDCDPVDWMKDKKTNNPKKVKEFASGTSVPGIAEYIDKINKMKGTSPKERKEMIDMYIKEHTPRAEKTSGKESSSSGKTGNKKKKKGTIEDKRIKARQAAETRLKGLMAPKGILESTKLAEARQAYETSIYRGKVPKSKILKMLAESRKRQIVRTAEPREKTKKELKIEKALAKAEEMPYKTGEELAAMKPGALKKYYAKIPKAEEKMVTETAKQRRLLRSEQRRVMEEAAMERVAPTRRRLVAARVGAVRAAKAVFTEEGRKKLAKEIKGITAAKVGRGVVRVAEGAIGTLQKIQVSPEAMVERGKAIAKAVPQGLRATYGKEERAATQKVRRLVRGGIKSVLGESLLQTRFGPAIRGRPSGPSGKYMIEGKPVFEEEYQKYAAQQRALNRLTPSTQQQTPVTPEEEQALQVPTETQYPSEKQPMSPGEIEASKTMETPQRGVTPEEVRMAQELAQQQDNVLNAPSFMKGELKATGGSLLTPTGPQIMDAPNAFKGQLRTLNRSQEIPAVRLSERPQTNPYGDEYIDIELGSGKPVLKKRPREKWMTGEAL